MSDVDVLVVGAGVVGLACARALALRQRAVMVLERNTAVAGETSSRNSGVIHAGIYYPPGSLRAQLCVDGKQRLYRFCAEHGVDVQRCGKLLVATGDAEVPRLAALVDNARANGVDDLQRLDAAGVAALEPDIRCVAGCLSPSTGIVDALGLARALDGHLQSLGGELVLDTTVHRVRAADDGFAVHFASGGEDGVIGARSLVVAAGHGSAALAMEGTVADGYQAPRTWPARGHYYRLDGRHRFRHLVYPMPDGAWLGTHLTLDTAGAVRFGPDNEWIDTVRYDFDDNPQRRQRFIDEVRRYYPGLDGDALVADYVGVRPKIYRPGEAVPDFAIHGPAQHGIDELVTLHGIESPGLTSCLAIAEHVADRLGEHAR